MLPPQLQARLDTLATFHKVVAALGAAFASFFLLHVVFGIATLLDPSILDDGRGGGPPAAFGWLFVGMGSAVVLTGWTFAALVWRTARLLRERRSYTFCIVIEAVLCAFAPFGTVLGVFGLMALMDPQVKAAFAEAAHPVPPLLPGAEVPGGLPHA